MWKSEWKMDKRWLAGKEKWCVLLACGLFFLIAASLPKEGKEERVRENRAEDVYAEDVRAIWSEQSVEAEQAKQKQGDTNASTDEMARYEKALEERVREILKHVDGVGSVDVMILLHSSGERVVHVDQDKNRTSTEEKDQQGGSRTVMTEDISEEALMSGGGSDSIPFVEKELRPEIAGIVISAEGGGSAVVKAEISEAMEALFGLPAHKIKVLKRVE